MVVTAKRGTAWQFRIGGYRVGSARRGMAVGVSLMRVWTVKA